MGPALHHGAVSAACVLSAEGFELRRLRQFARPSSGFGPRILRITQTRGELEKVPPQRPRGWTKGVAAGLVRPVLDGLGSLDHARGEPVERFLKVRQGRRKGGHHARPGRTLLNVARGPL